MKKNYYVEDYFTLRQDLKITSKQNEQRQVIFFPLKAIIFMVTWTAHSENGYGVTLLVLTHGAESNCLQK